MKLLSVELVDFRSFYGTHQLVLSSEGERKVTVFHGENGAGKTNLLNAIYWCFTGKFTPRFADPQLLVNKEARKNGVTSCAVELLIADGEGPDSQQYRVRRMGRSGDTSSVEVFKLNDGNSLPVPGGERLLRRMLPPGLVSWFFFDAEAIGALELSGSETFKQELRKTLGFDLIDTLVSDLEKVQSKRRREIANSVNNEQLKKIQERIDNVDRVLPDHKEGLLQLEQKRATLAARQAAVSAELAQKPQTEVIERRRKELEGRKRRLEDDKRQALTQVAQLTGQAAPPLILHQLTQRLEGRLQDQEVKGKLPSPFSDRLVKDIQEEQMCICGRPVHPGTPEAHKIEDLLRYATTGTLNERIREVRYLVTEIERDARERPIQIQEKRTQIVKLDTEIGEIEVELADISKQIAQIPVDDIKKLEQERASLAKDVQNRNIEMGKVIQLIESIEKSRAEDQANYDLLSKKVAVGSKLKKEEDKVRRLIEYIKKTLAKQERDALLLLSRELNTVLQRYLVKDFSARVDAKTYAVVLEDEEGKPVGQSTGEGQVLKFAFIATVVAMAAKKTTHKIQWLSEPTVAPLVLDAPFTALDPVYQGSVAGNLAKQTTQLVLMLSSAAWGQLVSDALNPFVGKRYLIVSKVTGAQGDRPVKQLTLGDMTYSLNEYEADRAESTFEEISA
ncbi:MAG: hypothetical protein QM750_29450 [Rubrivivax sp.]